MNRNHTGSLVLLIGLIGCSGAADKQEPTSEDSGHESVPTQVLVTMVGHIEDHEMLDDPVRISVEDLGLKPYLVPGDTGPQLNALSGRSYFVTDLYTNVTFPIGAGLLGAPKPRGSTSYIVREMPCNESLQYACSRRAEEEVHPFDGTLHPLFHLPAGNQPGYTGDPNGIMYREDTGLYHLFWQCTPERSTSGLPHPRNSAGRV